MLQEGDAMPDFDLPTDGDGRITLADTRGQKLVLYFYPKDNTSGCTRQACDFRDHHAAFAAAGVRVVGVSRDSVASHDRFRARYDLPFPLASDAEGTLGEACGTWVEKSMYGRKYMGIERTTFLVDATGRIDRIWRKVKVPGHVAAVLAAAGGSRAGR